MPADPFPNELVEAAAKALAGEPRCYCPDDWRADPSPRCPFHGDGEWPTYAHYLQARAALAAVLPLIERAVIERLAGEAGENPYEIAESVGAWGSSKLAWERGAAAGVAAERARLLSDAAVERAAGKLRTSGGYRDEDGDGFVLRDARAALSAALGVWE